MSLFIFFGMAALVTLVSTVYLSVGVYHHLTKSQMWLRYQERKLQNLEPVKK